VTRTLLTLVALLLVALAVQGATDSDVAAAFAAVLFIAVIVVRFEFWPGKGRR
jgi:hypothetical protein